MKTAFTLLLLLGTAAGLIAQPAQSTTPPTVALEFKAVSMGRGISDLGIMQSGKKIAFYAPALATSPSLNYIGTPELIFTQTQIIDGLSREESVATATVPPGVNRAVILFAQTSQNPQRYSTVVVPDTDTHAPLNSARIINYAKHAITLVVNDRPHTLASGATVTAPQRKGLIVLSIPKLNPESKDTAEVFNETYNVAQGSRMTLIITSSPKATTAKDQAVTVLALVDTVSNP